MNLLEAYKGRLSVADKIYSKTHQGEKLSESKKLMIASCLRNVNKLLDEAFDSSIGTQRSDMGAFRKFSLNLTNVALPNLIAPDIVLTYPMTAMSGYINYIKYVAANTKGKTTQGDVLNSPFALGEAHADYTSSRVEEEGSLEAAATTVEMGWKPVVAGTVDMTITAGSTIVRLMDDGKGKIYTVPVGTKVSRRTVVDTEEDGVLSGVEGHVEVVFGAGATEAGTVDYATGVITFTSAPGASTYVIKYAYNNVVIPQEKIPALKAKVEALPLIAKARRISITYSQIANYQAKNDYGFDLGEQLAEKAVGELSYEIDTEVCQMLIDNAEEDAGLVWSKTLPQGVNKQDHYSAFTEVIDQGATLIYNRTRKFSPNYMLVARNVVSILQFIPSWQAAPAGQVNGPYFAGSLNGIKVYVTPAMEDGRFVLGVNGNDAMTSAAVYAPYMPVVPTQLLGLPDGTMAQGWSTMYDLRLLNKALLVSGRITA